MIIIISLTFFTYPWYFSAGGVGSIQKYGFNFPRSFIANKFDSLILFDPNIDIPSKKIYNLDGTGYEKDSRYIYITPNNEDTVVFRFKFNNYEDSSKTVIALTHFGKNGEYPLKTTKDIFFFQRNSKVEPFEQILYKLNVPFSFIL